MKNRISNSAATAPLAAGPLLDIRLAQPDAGLYDCIRVKDANGWRDANVWENEAGGINTPKHGYDKFPNGKYTASGKYELTVEVAPHTVEPTRSHNGKAIYWLKTTCYDTRKEARTALMEHINSEQKQPAQLERRHFANEPARSRGYSMPGFDDEQPFYYTQYSNTYAIEDLMPDWKEEKPVSLHVVVFDELGCLATNAPGIFSSWEDAIEAYTYHLAADAAEAAGLPLPKFPARLIEKYGL